MSRQPFPPPVGAPAVWNFPTPTVQTLENGLDVWCYELPGQYIVSATLATKAPLSTEPRDREGVALLTSRTLDEGSERHPGDSFADLLESEGAAMGASISHAGSQVMLDVPLSHLPVTLPLLAEAVMAPELAADNVDRHRSLRLGEIEQAAANSAQTATRAFAGLVFPPEHRASRMSGGQAETVAAVTRDDVVAYHRERFTPTDSALILGGALAGQGLALAEAAFGHWQPRLAKAPSASTFERQAPRALLVHRPGAVQADLRLGGQGIDRHDERWAALSVAAYAMGGAFLSRLNRVLREERGYTYGVGLQLSPHRHRGSFAVAGSFRTDVLADAVVEARRLLDVSTAAFTCEEVREAVDYISGVSPLRYATAEAVVDQTALQVLTGLDSDYVDTHLTRIRAVTPESATQAYSEVIDPTQLTMVVVGDADELAPALRAVGIEIEVEVDVDD